MENPEVTDSEVTSVHISEAAAGIIAEDLPSAADVNTFVVDVNTGRTRKPVQTKVVHVEHPEHEGFKIGMRFVKVPNVT